MEIWKKIKGYEDLYQVSNYGRIKSNKYNKIMNGMKIPIKQRKRIYYCHRVRLYKDNKFKDFSVSRLVWETFKGTIPAGMQIDHINNDPQDNRLCNLQLLTCSENNIKKYKDNPELAKSFKHNLEKINPKRPIICLNNGIIYESIMDASRKLNINQKHIPAVCKGKRKHTLGYKFAYIDEKSINKNVQLVLF